MGVFHVFKLYKWYQIAQSVSCINSKVHFCYSLSIQAISSLLNDLIRCFSTHSKGILESIIVASMTHLFRHPLLCINRRQEQILGIGCKLFRNKSSISCSLNKPLNNLCATITALFEIKESKLWKNSRLCIFAHFLLKY